MIHGIPPTHHIAFNAIISLRKAHKLKALSRRWFRSWWKRSNLHKIKTKLLPMVRFEAAEESGVIKWFNSYKEVLRELKIRRRRNILNFDEAAFRIGCMNGQEIYVPMEIKQF